jgi:hypothetical protein
MGSPQSFGLCGHVPTGGVRAARIDSSSGLARKGLQAAAGARHEPTPRGRTWPALSTCDAVARTNAATKLVLGGRIWRAKVLEGHAAGRPCPWVAARVAEPCCQDGCLAPAFPGLTLA